MSSVPTALLGRSTEASTTRIESLGLYRAALWVLLGANLLAGWGVQWDIMWHVLLGRDSFWIPPHVMTYGGVTLIVLASFGVLARDTLRRLLAGRAPEGTERVLGLSGTPGFLLASCGIALAVLAAPIDDLWHRLFGIDVTLWSPPHLLGLLGVTVNTLACALVARKAYPAKSWPRYVALVLALTSFYGSLSIGLRPASRLAYLYGGPFLPPPRAPLLSLLPVILLVRCDPRRRPVLASVIYAGGLFAPWGLTIGRTPAFQPMMPGLGPTVGALLITIAMGLIGGAAARWLAESLARFEPTRAMV